METNEGPAAPHWEEPRGPHLPDTLTALPAAIWPFVVLAAVVAWLRISRMSGASPDPVNAAWSVLSVVRVAAVVLLPAALVLRHPDARARPRTLMRALTLLAAAELLSAVAPVIGDLIGGADAGAPGWPILTPGYLVGRLGSIVGLFAAGYLWIGLSAARRAPDPARAPLARGGALVVAAAVMLFGIVGLLQSGVLDGETTVVVANAIALALSALSWLAWVVIAMVLVAGAATGETPVVAWRLGAGGALGFVVVQNGIWWLLDAFGTSAADVSVVAMRLAGLSSAVGALLLLAAFAIGLPEDEAG